MKLYTPYKTLLLTLTLGLSCLLSGCATQRATVERMGADVALRFAENNLVGPMLAGDDMSMACGSGEAMTPMIMAIGGGFNADDDQLVTLLYTVAALCTESRGLEQELRYLRASRSNNIDEAQDARIGQKRLAALAAKRQYQAYVRFEHYQKKNGIVLGEKCPTFKRDFDELVFMTGLLSGLQAIVNDINSQNSIGVPKDIAPLVDRSMVCLNNEKWFGVPMAARAVVWSMLPGAGEGQDPWATLEQSLKIGESKGVRLAHALYATVAATKEDNPHLRDAFKRFAASQNSESFKLNNKYQLFDQMGGAVLLALADRYWTSNTGSRTPEGGLETFWDDQQGARDVGIAIDDLL